MVSLPPSNGRRPTADIEFVFREVRTAREMRDVLALRYGVYRRLPTMDWSIDHTSQLDVDGFDLTSRHFALIARSGKRECVVGSLRITTDVVSPQLASLLAVRATHPSVVARLTVGRRERLPMLSYLDRAGAIDSYVTERIRRGERVAEAGRFAIEPRVLIAAGRHGARLAHHVIISAIAHACHIDPLDRVLVDARCCAPHLERLYRSYGFERGTVLPATASNAAGLEFAILEATPASVPPALRAQVHAIADQFRSKGEATMGREIVAPRAVLFPADTLAARGPI